MKKVYSKWKQWCSLSAIVIAAVVVIVLGYSWSRTSNLLIGPELSITPVKSPISDTPLIVLAGEVKRVAHLQLNDGQIFADSNGRFAEQLLLRPGYNIIKVEAVDRFGRRVNHLLDVAYQPISIN